MNDSILLAVGVVAILVVCAVAFLLIRYLPKIRYLPSGLLLGLGLLLFLPAACTAPSGGGISGFGDLGRAAGMILGLFCMLLSGVTFLLSWLLYRWVLYYRSGRSWHDTAI